MTPTESIEIWCDAPPYRVVQACRLIGVRSPEDVRWCHLGHLRGDCGARSVLRSALSWLWRLTGNGGPDRCSCGAPLPALQPFRFLFDHGDLPTYWLGQCDRCRTVYWEEDEQGT
jgi:hypothetical protein